MVSDAQKRASAKYQRLNTKQINLKFSPNEIELYEWVKSQSDAASTVVKNLIRKAMQDQK